MANELGKILVRLGNPTTTGRVLLTFLMHQPISFRGTSWWRLGPLPEPGRVFWKSSPGVQGHGDRAVPEAGDPRFKEGLLFQEFLLKL